MKTYKLFEVIERNDNNFYVSYENQKMYIKSLYTYYKDYFNCEPIALITNVTNVGGVMRIVSENEFNEAIYEEMGVHYVETDERNPHYNEDLFYEYDIINANSRYLKDLL